MHIPVKINKMKVNFLIAGFQKCGTTALYEFIKNHPEVIGPKHKELDFFNYDVNYNKGIASYHSNFRYKYFLYKLRDYIFLKSSSSCEYKFFEASPSYINDKNIYITANRIYKYNKKVKIIVLVRNPIDRAFSAWNMYRKRFFEGNINWWFNWVEKRTGVKSKAIRRQQIEYKDFNLFIKKELETIEKNDKIECPVLSNGHYYNGIKEFKKKFKDQVLIIKSEELYSKTSMELKRIAKFLNLSNYNWEKFDGIKVFEGKYEERIDSETYKILKAHYKESNNKLFRLTGINYD